MYERILRHVLDQAWAIEPRRLSDIVDVLAYQAQGGKLTAEEVAQYADLHAARMSARDQSVGAIQVIPIRGIISHRASMVENMSGAGATSVETLRSRLSEAMAARDVSTVLFDVDSPGGSVQGIQELASEIADAAKSKRIVASANANAQSAAYWLASAASEFVATPSADVGSIGVYTAHHDLSEALEKEGQRVTLISAGPHKVEGNPFEPLSDEAAGYIQARVNQAYQAFVGAVADGRGVSRETVINDFGGGRSLSARQAMDAGMVDRVESFPDTLARLVREQTPKARGTTPPSAFSFLR